MALVYRVEDSKGSGPYRSQYYETLMLPSRCEERHSNDEHPCPAEDRILHRYMYTDEYCGFKDLDQFRAWFNLRDRRKLDSQGLSLAVYRVSNSNITYGEHQVLFYKGRADKIKEYSLLTKKKA